MVASSLKDDESGVLKAEGAGSGLLKASAVFGPNSSGKSYIVKAVQSLKIVVGSARPEGAMPEYIPFRLSKDCLNAPVEFSIRVLKDGTVYEYSISYRSDRIVSESLRRKVGRKYEPVFSRGTDKDMMDPVVKERLTGTTAYLNIAPGFNYPVCNAVLQEFLGIMTEGHGHVGEHNPPMVVQRVERALVKTVLVVQEVLRRLFLLVQVVLHYGDVLDVPDKFRTDKLQ